MERNLLNADNIIAQDMLRQVESLCTTEEPPACSSACPLHLDVRELCRLIADGKSSEAFKLYQKQIPFASIISRTCSAPCREACRRGEIGGSMEIRALEQAISANSGPRKPPILLPKKDKRAAVAGGGLRGLAAADFLARKGYKVTIFEKSDRLGGRLWDLDDCVLPGDVLEAEIKNLLKMPVEAKCCVCVPADTPEAAANLLLDGFDAAFVAFSSPLDGLADVETMQVKGHDALFAGKRAGRMTDGPSAIYDVYEGRSAGTSIDRLFQGVSLMAGREKEGSHTTGLFTNPDGIASSPPVHASAGGYTPDEAKNEASRCIQCQCMECVKKCAFLQNYGGTPRRYVREVYNNLSIAMGIHHANTMINTCAQCRQCEAICPNGLDMSQVFRAARRRMAETEKMPPSAHEFALLDMEFSFSDEFFLARHQPGHDSSRHLFFPGCQLPASEPELTGEIYKRLMDLESGGVGLLLSCCGIMAKWAGRDNILEEAGDRIKAAWRSLGEPQIICACPTCASTLSEDFGLPCRSVFEVFVQSGFALTSPAANEKMILHHACGSRHDDRTKSQVSELAALAGVEIIESTIEDNEYPCCGYGGLTPLVSDEIGDGMTRCAIEQMGSGAPILTYCVNCRDRFLKEGRSSCHLLEILSSNPETLRHASPTWSERQENRAGLRRRLLNELWSENISEAKRMKLFISPDLEEKLEKSHILHSDLEKAIAGAEADGSRLISAGTGHFTACCRPGNVTFWAEYTPRDDGFEIYNAWSHRMDAVLTGRLGGNQEAEQ